MLAEKRARRRTLIRNAAATVIGSTAVVSGAVNNNQEQKYTQRNKGATLSQGYSPELLSTSQPAATFLPETDSMVHLLHLYELHLAGVLSDEEFLCAKQRLLAS